MIKKTLIVLLLYISSLAAMECSFPSGEALVDQADLLSAQEESLLRSQLTSFRSDGLDFAIATVPNLGGLGPQEYANALFEACHFGEEKDDNGLLLLLSVEPHRWQFETGYGLEQYVPDAYLKQVGAGILSPAWKNGTLFQGLLQILPGIHENAAKAKYSPCSGARGKEGTKAKPSALLRLAKILLGFTSAFLLFCIPLLRRYYELGQLPKDQEDLQKISDSLERGAFLGRPIVFYMMFGFACLLFGSTLGVFYLSIYPFFMIFSFFPWLVLVGLREKTILRKRFYRVLLAMPGVSKCDNRDALFSNSMLSLEVQLGVYVCECFLMDGKQILIRTHGTNFKSYLLCSQCGAMAVKKEIVCDAADREVLEKQCLYCHQKEEIILGPRENRTGMGGVSNDSFGGYSSGIGDCSSDSGSGDSGGGDSGGSDSGGGDSGGGGAGGD